MPEQSTPKLSLSLLGNASPTHPPHPKGSKRIWKFPSVDMLFFSELSVCDSLLPVHHLCPSLVLFLSNPFSLQLLLCYQGASYYLIIKSKSKGWQDDYISKDVCAQYLAIWFLSIGLYMRPLHSTQIEWNKKIRKNSFKKWIVGPDDILLYI